MAKKYDKEALLADWKAGGYSQRALAKKYKISNGLVAKLTKGVAKDNEQLVKKIIDNKQELDNKKPSELSAINEQVERGVLKNKIDALLDKGLGLATKTGISLLQQSDVTMQDVSSFGRFSIDAKKSIGTLTDSHSTIINNTNAQQNVQPTKIEIVAG